MSNFLKSFSPLLKKLKLKKYLVEIALLTTALSITIISLTLYIKNNQTNTNKETLINDQPEQVISENVIVDVSGAVKKPNIYKISFGARIKDVVDLAGGLSEDADELFFRRNFNLARIVSDQEKIYIPSISEINNGIFIQNQLLLDYNFPIVIPQSKMENIQQKSQLIISINNSTVEELDQLPGIGQVTASKIVNGRPYKDMEELVTKKIINKNVFDKLINLISL